MPLLKNAKKALRSSIRKAEFNSRARSRMKTAIKAIQTTATKEGLAVAYSAIDRATKRHLLHANKAARLKSQLSKLAPSA